MISIQYIIFGILAVLVIVSALGMLFSKNAMYSVIFLVFNFAIVAVLYLSLGAPFIAFAQITVYAGSIMVLFLFLIMLLGAEHTPMIETLRFHRPITFIAAFLFLFAVGLLVVWRGGSFEILPELSSDFASPNVIGLTLYTEYLFPFMIIAFTLLVSTIGAILLTRDDKPAKARLPKREEE